MLNVYHHLFLPRPIEPYHFHANLIRRDGPSLDCVAKSDLNYWTTFSILYCK